MSGVEAGGSPGHIRAAIASPNWSGYAPDILSCWDFPLTFLTPVTASTWIFTNLRSPWILRSGSGRMGQWLDPSHDWREWTHHSRASRTQSSQIQPGFNVWSCRRNGSMILEGRMLLLWKTWTSKVPLSLQWYDTHSVREWGSLREHQKQPRRWQHSPAQRLLQLGHTQSSAQGGQIRNRPPEPEGAAGWLSSWIRYKRLLVVVWYYPSPGIVFAFLWFRDLWATFPELSCNQGTPLA